MAEAMGHTPGSLDIFWMVAGHLIPCQLFLLPFWSRLGSISGSLYLFSSLVLQGSKARCFKATAGAAIQSGAVSESSPAKHWRFESHGKYNMVA